MSWYHNVVKTTGERNVAAFLDAVAHAEGTIIYGNEDGYNVMVGGSTFDDYSDHPRKLVNLPSYGIKSSAAGRYQFLQGTWDDLARRYGLSDFSPENQDTAAVYLIKEQGALKDVIEGRFAEAVKKVSNIWASFPDAGYGQPEKKLEELLQVYVASGGYVADK